MSSSSKNCWLRLLQEREAGGVIMNVNVQISKYYEQSLAFFEYQDYHKPKKEHFLKIMVLHQ